MKTSPNQTIKPIAIFVENLQDCRNEVPIHKGSANNNSYKILHDTRLIDGAHFGIGQISIVQHGINVIEPSVTIGVIGLGGALIKPLNAPPYNINTQTDYLLEKAVYFPILTEVSIIFKKKGSVIVYLYPTNTVDLAKRLPFTDLREYNPFIGEFEKYTFANYFTPDNKEVTPPTPKKTVFFDLNPEEFFGAQQRPKEQFERIPEPPKYESRQNESPESMSENRKFFEPFVHAGMMSRKKADAIAMTIDVFGGGKSVNSMIAEIPKIMEERASLKATLNTYNERLQENNELYKEYIEGQNMAKFRMGLASRIVEIQLGAGMCHGGDIAHATVIENAITITDKLIAALDVVKVDADKQGESKGDMERHGAEPPKNKVEKQKRRYVPRKPKEEMDSLRKQDREGYVDSDGYRFTLAEYENYAMTLKLAPYPALQRMLGEYAKLSSEFPQHAKQKIKNDRLARIREINKEEATKNK